MQSNSKKGEGGIHVFFAPLVETFTETTLTYRIELFTPDLKPFKAQQATSDGISCWVAITPLSFKEVSTGGGIVLRLTADGTDGLNGELARGFALSSINFDEAGDWLH
jgi:hypothetical protein